MAKKRTLLLIEDDRAIREVVRRYLEAEGYAVAEAETLPEALISLRLERYDLLLLDLTLPGGDGMSILRALQHQPDIAAQQGELPVIIITSRGKETERLAGFEQGVDDYVIKPFSPRELVARVKAVLRRAHADEPPDQPITIRQLHLDPRGRAVSNADMPITLTAREFDLLWLFASNPGRVFSREQLISKVWGHEFDGDDGTLTVYVHRLREKIDLEADSPTLIQTVWGIGYKFAP